VDSALQDAQPFASSQPLPELSQPLVAASQPYVGRWNHLVSTTNWEKGRIIVQWREALAAQGLPASEYSDEAWSRLVGGVSGQHVGRLRRVYQRFHTVREQFAGLYWSHFQAALDWDDAEMWLEGARASGWSVAQMRQTRGETLGKVEADRPRREDEIAAEMDEDAESNSQTLPAALRGEYAEVTGPLHDGPDFGDAEPPPREALDEGEPFGAERAPVELVRPFESLPDLPDDLAEALEHMKLALLRDQPAGGARGARGAQGAGARAAERRSGLGWRSETLAIPASA
jgi:hypothetical protein